MEKHNDGIAATGICGCTNASKPKFKVGDRVRVRKNIAERDNSYGFFPLGMAQYEGKTMTVKGIQIPSPSTLLYTFENCGGGIFDWVWREEWLEPAPEASKSAKKLIVTTDGVTTTAKLIDGKQTIKTATAKCSKDDEFCFETGAQIAVDRLLGRKPAEPEKPKFTKDDLENGMFGYSVVNGEQDYKWFVVCNGSFVYEAGGFDRIDALDSRMRFPGDYGYVAVVIKGAVSFDSAKVMHARCQGFVYERK